MSEPECLEVAKQTHMSYTFIERRLASSTQPSTGSIVGVKYVARTCTCTSGCERSNAVERIVSVE